MTLGEKRIRVTFNPSEDNYVDQIKQKTAELIDIMDRMMNSKDLDPALGINKEFERLKALAITNYEQAAMWAVKALTV